MNIELDDVAVQDVSDDALEHAAGVVQGCQHRSVLIRSLAARYCALDNR